MTTEFDPADVQALLEDLGFGGRCYYANGPDPCPDRAEYLDTSDDAYEVLPYCYFHHDFRGFAPLWPREKTEGGT